MVKLASQWFIATLMNISLFVGYLEILEHIIVTLISNSYSLSLCFLLDFIFYSVKVDQRRLQIKGSHS